MLNELLVSWALWLDAMPWSTALHESLYLHAWVESTHVLALTLFLGMLLIIDLRMLGLAFADVPAPLLAERLDKPMLVGLAVMGEGDSHSTDRTSHNQPEVVDAGYRAGNGFGGRGDVAGLGVAHVASPWFRMLGEEA